MITNEDETEVVKTSVFFIAMHPKEANDNMFCRFCPREKDDCS